MNKLEGYPPSLLVTATCFKQNEPLGSHSNIFGDLYRFPTFLTSFIFCCRKTAGLAYRKWLPKEPPGATAALQGVSEKHPGAPKEPPGSTQELSRSPQDPPGAPQSFQKHPKSSWGVSESYWGGPPSLQAAELPSLQASKPVSLQASGLPSL